MMKPRNESHSSSTGLPQNTKEIPRAGGLPLIGNVPALLREPFSFLEQSTKELGDIYRIDLGVTRPIILCRPEHAQHVLQGNAANYLKAGPMWTLVRDLMGNGLVVSDGDFWKRQRRMMQPEFHTRRLAVLTRHMVDGIVESLDTWQADASAGREIGLVTANNRVTMRVILTALFGSSLTKDEMDRVSVSMTTIIDYIIRGVATGSLPDRLPLPGKRKFHNAIEDFDKTLYRIIEEQRAHDSPPEEERSTLLAMLMNTVDEETGEQMTDQQLRDEVATLFVAGYETTSMGISWALHHLANQADVADAVCAEVEQVLGGRTPTFEDLPKLDLTRRVFDESLRVSPSVWMLPRQAVEDDIIDGHRIKAGSDVVLLNYMIHRHPDHWADPDRFDPDRFTEANSKGRHQYAYTPYGGGRRLCLGKAFAEMEGTLILALITQRFRARPESLDIKPALSTTLRPKGNPALLLESR